MIAWLVWFFGVLPLLVFDAWLRCRSAWSPDLTLAICSFAALQARPAALPGLLLCTALARSVVEPGGMAVHMLLLGIPVAALLPLRILFYRRELVVQVAAAGFLALALPHLTGFLARLAPEAGLSLEAARRNLLAALILVPPAAFGLGVLPPLRWFAERAE